MSTFFLSARIIITVSKGDNKAMDDVIKYELCPTREEYPALIIKSGGSQQALHSRVYPSKESASMEAELQPAGSDICIVLGVGLGYHLIPLKKYAALYKKIILADILPEVRELTASVEICEFLSGTDNIVFLGGLAPNMFRETLSPMIDLEKAKGIKIVTHAASMRIFGTYYTSLKEAIESLINFKAGNAATVKAFGGLYARNCIKNIARLNRMMPVAKLFGKFTDSSALVIMPGPSLETSMETISKISNDIFIIAPDSALPVCEAYGFYPDFIVSVDPQAYISEHLLGFWNKDMRLVTSLSSWNCSLANYASSWRIYCSLNSHPFAQLIDELFPETVGALDSGSGSVAGDALLFAFRCGFSQIACAGFDFGFAGGVTYSRESAYQRRYAKIFMNRLKSAETFNFDYIMKSSKALREDGRFTRRSFLQYRQSIEAVIEKFAQPELIHINPPNRAMAGYKAAGEDSLSNLKKSDKASILSKAELGVKPLGEILDLSEISRVISEEKIFTELIRRSCGENSKTERYRELFESVRS